MLKYCRCFILDSFILAFLLESSFVFDIEECTNVSSHLRSRGGTKRGQIQEDAVHREETAGLRSSDKGIQLSGGASMTRYSLQDGRFFHFFISSISISIGYCLIVCWIFTCEEPHQSFSALFMSDFCLTVDKESSLPL